MFSQNSFSAPDLTRYEKFIKHYAQFLRNVLGMRVHPSPEWKRWAEETLKWLTYTI